MMFSLPNLYHSDRSHNPMLGAVDTGTLQPCASTADAAWTGCVVVPCVTAGTLCQSNTPYTDVWAGQPVDMGGSGSKVQEAFTQNTQAAADAGHPVISTADPGTPNQSGGVGLDTATDGNGGNNNSDGSSSNAATNNAVSGDSLIPGVSDNALVLGLFGAISLALLSGK